MQPLPRLVLLALAAGLLLTASPAVSAPQPARVNISAAAVIDPKDPKHEYFLKRHAEILARGQQPIGLLFLGDSITEQWKVAPELWQKQYGSYQPANFGIGGDTTQGVLWRIEHGELDGLHPRVVVLLLGTNNTSQDLYTGKEVAAADAKIVGLIQQKTPEAKIIIIGIFPRGPRKSSSGAFDDGAKHMPAIREANVELAKLDDGDRVRFLDFGAQFVGPDGKIPDALMADHLHPTERGYHIWAEAMQPLLNSIW